MLFQEQWSMAEHVCRRWNTLKKSIITQSFEGFYRNIWNIVFLTMCMSWFTELPCQRECQNGGTCLSGLCRCPEGFTGVACEHEGRSISVLEWELCLVKASSYTSSQYPITLHFICPHLFQSKFSSHIDFLPSLLSAFLWFPVDQA